MLAIGQWNVNSLDIAVRNEVIIIAIGARDLKRLSEFLCARQITAGNCDDRGVLQTQQSWND